MPLFSVRTSNSERARSNRLDLVHVDIFYYSALPLCMCVCVCKGDAAAKGGCMQRENLPGRGKEEKDRKTHRGAGM